MARLDRKVSSKLRMRRRALAEKYMSKTPQELMTLLTDGDISEGTTPAQESRRMLVFCVMAARSQLDR